MPRRWYKDQPKLARQAMRTMALLISEGLSESVAAGRVSQQAAVGKPTLLKLWRQARKYVEIPERKQMALFCLYCGQPDTPRERMILVMDYRRVAVLAHMNCESREQLVAGSLKIG